MQRYSFNASFWQAGAIFLGLLLVCDGAFAAEISSSAGSLQKVRRGALSAASAARSKTPQSVTARMPSAHIGKSRLNGTPMRGGIRLYGEKPLALFSDKCLIATEMPPSPFPFFTNLPENLHMFSYSETQFSRPKFKASDCSTPWLLFDNQDHALVISPASHFK